MGAQTFGKGSVQTVIEFEDGSGLKLTIARYFTPKGRSIQEHGITPDFVLDDSQGKDPVREKDLKRHFKNDQSVSSKDETPRQLPQNLKDWAVTEKLSDGQLKVALNYLHATSSALADRSRIATQR
jgi:carboxyl-terminal processing protease